MKYCKPIDRQLHVVMFPWFAQGHITPFLDLAKSLLTSGLRISFVSTPVNIEWIKKKIVPGIELVELQLPSMEGLPGSVESTTGLSEIGRTDLVPLLFQAIDLCELPFGALLKLLSLDFIIFDAALWWTPWVADKMGIPTINFMVVDMVAMSFAIGQYRQRLPDIPTAEDLTIPLPRFPPLVIHLRTFEAWKERSTGQFMFPIGISMHSLPPWPDANRCLAWLDKQPTRSVVFACFDSECPLTAQDLAALLLGLEESEISFLLFLFRHARVELHRVSEDCTHGRGLMVTNWAPQLHILNHPSTGAFFSHCWWNSVTKGLRFGMPIVAIPIQFDQPLFARLIVHELKMGVEVKRNKEDGSFTKEDVAKAVIAVMVDCSRSYNG
ncbi:putative UDP-rhamnose:rhamnosyltransferase 1 [Cryptomeria japonica]|uniref:putative UDP-rhamnose:rhamnosyltransferase 1 n=1 Tax=Cryptomeria japonica TaxID=3369 RepID=UPI0027DA4D69|nr:putative UDP-rhamnose:rhamnosyltransferase 1 [Cryptomeria japonica]